VDWCIAYFRLESDGLTCAQPVSITLILNGTANNHERGHVMSVTDDQAVYFLRTAINTF
jgi:hypothetical protein